MIFVPYQLERLLWYGLLLCLDSFLVGCSCSLALHTLLQALYVWHEAASANSCSHALVVLSLTQSCAAGACPSREAGLIQMCARSAGFWVRFSPRLHSMQTCARPHVHPIIPPHRFKV